MTSSAGPSVRGPEAETPLFDHLGARCFDAERSLPFYDALFAALGRAATYAEGVDREWEDFCVSPVDAAHPVATTGLHVVLGAVDASADGGVRLDPDGNVVEVVRHGAPGPAAIVHATIRVPDHAAALPFYRLLAEHAGLEVVPGGDRATRFVRDGRAFSIVQDDRPITRGLHFALPAPEATVLAWHAAAVAAGFRDNGAPGERPYHEGYYGAFVLDPAGHNVELVDHHR